jgi:23S rRNA (uracil1939-C5)-methyltransferase
MRRKSDRKPLIVEKVFIKGLADKGRGVGRTDAGQVIFVDMTTPGDLVDVHVLKKKDFLEGVPVHFHERSTERTEPFCEHFGICGGCKLQHIQYPVQLRLKEQIVRDAFQRIGKIEVQDFQPIVGAVKHTYYRNKIEFAFSNKRWLTLEEMESGISNRENVLGFHRAGAFDKLVHINHCYLQDDPSNAIRNTIFKIATDQNLSFFDIKEQHGFLRQMMMRITTTGDILLIIGFYFEDKPARTAFLDEIVKAFPQITSLQYCINPKGNDSFYGLSIVPYYGKSYIEENLGKVKFRIGPHSFFQTSTKQAEKLFDTVVDFAEFDGTENVYDLYTGLGSIALYVADKCKHVVGIEEIPEAITDAIDNAQRNEITNTTFYAGDVKNILTDDFARKHGKPDILITDPPRAGMHEKVVEMLLKLEAPKVIYVSCNPATQARDLNLLSAKYEVVKVRPVDMFPYTHHIENVALLRLKPLEERVTAQSENE